jgi:multimeric flavodoxin WrbA
MKVMAFNGSPRKQWNTAQLLEKALQGAAQQGAAIELVHLYDLDYQGCISCFACKTKGGKSYARCVVEDDLTPFLKAILDTKALLCGSPIYYGTVTGEMRSFLERLWFPFSTYTDPPQSLFPGKIATAFIYTMNATEAAANERGFHHHIKATEMIMERIFGAAESLCSYDTYQFEDYAQVFAPRFDPEEKARRRREVFPLDLAKAFALGQRLVGKEAR